MIELPDLPAGGDLVEFIAAHGGDVEKARADIEAMVTSAATIAPDRPTPPVEPFQPFPVDALPEPLRRLVTIGAKAMVCEPSFVALPLLAGAASAIGNARRVQLKRGWSEPAIVWAAIVGDSGTLKSPAIEAALLPVRAQRKAMREHAEAMKEFRVELAHHGASCRHGRSRSPAMIRRRAPRAADRGSVLDGRRHDRSAGGAAGRSVARAAHRARRAGRLDQRIRSVRGRQGR